MDDKEFLASCKIPWGDQKGTTVTPEIIACLSNACEQMLPDLQKFDRIKRSLAYGEKLREYVDPLKLNEMRGLMSNIHSPGFLQSDSDKSMLHALLGCFTEAVEKLEIIHAWIRGCGLNVNHLAEEVGDGMFYDHIIMDLLKLTPEVIKQMNHNKLQSRYKDGFTSDKAINRNTNGEQKAMESSLDTIIHRK
tara:strand:+ start:673 stop:1248 length:576 start_codon:yes stop_codon:yes gene_type:complete